MAGWASDVVFCEPGGYDASRNLGVWKAGNLVLSVCASKGLAAGVGYRITLFVRNPRAAVVSPAMQVEASGSWRIVATEMQKSQDNLFGVENGTHPFFVVVGEFSLTYVAQSTPVAARQNTLTARFVLNVEISCR